jgi:hypothetical protein
MLHVAYYSIYILQRNARSPMFQLQVTEMLELFGYTVRKGSS